MHFLGGAGTVTGSKTIVDFNDFRLMVDCGLFQGVKSLRKKNWEKLPEAENVNEVVLTHAHLDHCGYLPRLVKQGFEGPIHCTDITARLVEIILYDSAKIQMEDAERANSHTYSKHHPAQPLYDDKDVKQCLKQIVIHKPGEWVVPAPDMRFRFIENGHIPGSCMVELHTGSKSFVFSGDLGRLKPLIMAKPMQLPACDYLILESTYGDRLHSQEPPEDMLADMINPAANRGAQILMPSFAVERAQEMIYLLIKLMIEDRIPRLKVYLDSPMAAKVTEVLEDYYDFMRDPEFRDMLSKQLEVVSDYRASRTVVQMPGPKIVIAGSGMITGGRILHHLAAHISNPNTLVILPGFQAPGTRGESILHGAPEIKFFGDYHKLKAEVRQMDTLSAHADRDELIEWVRTAESLPTRVFLNHGEESASDSLRVKLEDELKIPVSTTHPLMEVILDYDQKDDSETIQG
jgi:metallo-beta-lactamase family protein